MKTEAHHATEKRSLMSRLWKRVFPPHACEFHRDRSVGGYGFLKEVCACGLVRYYTRTDGWSEPGMEK